MAERERETQEGWGLRVLRKEHLGVYREENKRGGGGERKHSERESVASHRANQSS